MISAWWWLPHSSHPFIMFGCSCLCGLNQYVDMCDSHERWLHTWCESLQWSRVTAVSQTVNSTNRADVNTGLLPLMCHESCPRLCLLSRHTSKWSASARKERSGPTLKAQYPRSRWRKSAINYFIWSAGGAAPRWRSSSTSLVCCVKCKIVSRQARTRPEGVVMVLFARPDVVLFGTCPIYDASVWAWVFFNCPWEEYLFALVFLAVAGGVTWRCFNLA